MAAALNATCPAIEPLCPCVPTRTRSLDFACLLGTGHLEEGATDFADEDENHTWPGNHIIAWLIVLASLHVLLLLIRKIH